MTKVTHIAQEILAGVIVAALVALGSAGLNSIMNDIYVEFACGIAFGFLGGTLSLMYGEIRSFISFMLTLIIALVVFAF